MACQKDDGQAIATLAQLRQHVNAGGGRQGPIQYDKVGIGRDIERCQERFAIGEALDRKASLVQLATERLSEIVVVFNEKDAYRPVPPIRDTGCLAAELGPSCTVT
jgi:hypothetical protein